MQRRSFLKFLAGSFLAPVLSGVQASLVQEELEEPEARVWLLDHDLEVRSPCTYLKVGDVQPTTFPVTETFTAVGVRVEIWDRRGLLSSSIQRFTKKTMVSGDTLQLTGLSWL